LAFELVPSKKARFSWLFFGVKVQNFRKQLFDEKRVVFCETVLDSSGVLVFAKEPYAEIT